MVKKRKKMRTSYPGQEPHAGKTATKGLKKETSYRHIELHANKTIIKNQSTSR